MEKPTVLIIGDAMLDKHIMGRVSRISPEAPVPVIQSDLERRVFLGAAANVAAQIAEAGFSTILAHKHFTVNSTDPREQKGWLNISDLTEGSELFDKIIEAGFDAFPLFYTGVDGPLTTKERIWTGQQQICRVDYEDKRRPTPEIEEIWIRQLLELIEDHNIETVIFSDYDKGTLTDRIIQAVADFVWDNDGLTILDPKRHSYWGLQHLTIIKPNRQEIEMTHMSPVDISKELGETWLLNTLSEDGMKLWKDGAHVASERVYSSPSEVIDVCGCGDTTTAFLAIAMLRGKKIEEAMRYASIAASVNLKHRGCHVLDQNEIDWVFDPSGNMLIGGR
jgi:D-beta-D-heptose 7-phosphate kinase/D-beta-D-heptose 1-phosphate adenosyltransferase